MFHPEITPQQRPILDVLSIGSLLFTFSIVMLLAGCGIGPVGLVMIFGDLSAWGIPMIAGWIGVALLFASIFIHSKGYYLWVSMAALVMFVVSWCGFIAGVEEVYSRVATLVTSIPFGVALFLRIGMLYLVYSRFWR